MGWARKRLWVAVVVAASIAGGCGAAGTKIAKPQAKLPAGENSAAFFDRVSSQPTVSENDAMRGVLMLVTGKDEAATFKGRVEALQAKKIVSAGWRLDADRPVTKGRLAYMLYQACKMPGGVILTLTGPSRRYCLREFQYRRMMVRGSMFTPVTGMEFVAVLTRADIYIRTGKIPDLAGETEEG